MFQHRFVGSQPLSNHSGAISDSSSPIDMFDQKTTKHLRYLTFLSHGCLFLVTRESPAKPKTKRNSTHHDSVFRAIGQMRRRCCQSASQPRSELMTCVFFFPRADASSKYRSNICKDAEFLGLLNSEPKKKHVEEI